MVARRDRIVAETKTGARIKMAKGLSRPPVKYSKLDNWSASNTNNVNACPSPRRAPPERIAVITRFEITRTVMAERQ